MSIIKAPSKTALHSFPRAIARKHGVTAAVVLKHLAHKVRGSKNVHDGKSWHYNPLTELANKFGYIPASTLGAVVKRMQKAGLIEIGNYNRWAHDRTNWYHVPQPYLDQAEEDLISFDPKIARDHGIPAAMLLENLRYFIKLKTKKTKSPDIEHEMSPTALARLLPLNVAKIKRALKLLVDAELIEKTSKSKPIYKLL